jgi:hypothetical protein
MKTCKYGLGEVPLRNLEISREEELGDLGMTE